MNENLPLGHKFDRVHSRANRSFSVTTENDKMENESQSRKTGSLIGSATDNGTRNKPIRFK